MRVKVNAFVSIIASYTGHFTLRALFTKRFMGFYLVIRQDCFTTNIVIFAFYAKFGH